MRTSVIHITKLMNQIKSGIPEDWYVLENENVDGTIIWQDTSWNVYYNTKKIHSSLSEFVQNFSKNYNGD